MTRITQTPGGKSSIVFGTEENPLSPRAAASPAAPAKEVKAEEVAAANDPAPATEQVAPAEELDAQALEHLKLQVMHMFHLINHATHAFCHRQDHTSLHELTATCARGNGSGHLHYFQAQVRQRRYCRCYQVAP